MSLCLHIRELSKLQAALFICEAGDLLKLGRETPLVKSLNLVVEGM